MITESSGTVFPQSLAILTREIKIQPNDCLLDLGSGTGEILFYFAKYAPLQNLKGIELNEKAVHQSRKLLQIFSNKFITVEQGDLLNLSYLDATILFVNAMCFSQAMLIKITHLANISPISTIFSLRPLPHLCKLPLVKVVKVQCSWDSALCYVYQK